MIVYLSAFEHSNLLFHPKHNRIIWGSWSDHLSNFDQPEPGDIVNHFIMKACILGIFHNKNTAVFKKIITEAVFEPPGKEFHHLFNWNKANQHLL